MSKSTPLSVGSSILDLLLIRISSSLYVHFFLAGNAWNLVNFIGDKDSNFDLKLACFSGGKTNCSI